MRLYNKTTGQKMNLNYQNDLFLNYQIIFEEKRFLESLTFSWIIGPDPSWSGSSEKSLQISALINVKLIHDWMPWLQFSSNNPHGNLYQT